LQANWTGVPGYPPAWHFLRNGLLGDLFFLAVFLLILDRPLLFAPFTRRSMAVVTKPV
jgi:hypothetical protein